MGCSFGRTLTPTNPHNSPTGPRSAAPRPSRCPVPRRPTCSASKTVVRSQSMPLVVVLRKFLPYILTLAVILGMGFWIHRSGYQSGVDATTRMYEHRIQEERERLLAANQAAQEAARKKEAELQRLLSERNDTIRVLMQEAFNDPNAGNVAIGADSVRRIDRIR